jgi:alpha-1,4-digalacturonate transport system permease protein
MQRASLTMNRANTLAAFLTRLHGGNRFSTIDLLTYGYLFFGTIVMFGPVLWLVMSSFKTEAALYDGRPTFWPYSPQTVQVEGYADPLTLYNATVDGQTRQLAQVSRVGLVARMVDPQDPTTIIEVNIRDRSPVMVLRFAIENYSGALQAFPFFTYFTNSVIVTASATVITLLFNSMAAYGLSKYHFRGRDSIFVLMISTLLVPVSIIMIPAFYVISQIGWSNSLLGLILPGAATPTGVFLLRQYMLTIPDELIDAARVDGASEWRIYWAIVLPLSAPALAVLAIFSIMWRWNDFLWPLIVVTRNELFTLPVALNSFQGELDVQWHYVLALTVMMMAPVMVVFAFLQKFITTGIATTGIK